jgi:hypothetical protein
MRRAVAPLLMALAIVSLAAQDPAPSGYGMMNQIRAFAARVKSGEITFDPPWDVG